MIKMNEEQLTSEDTIITCLSFLTFLELKTKINLILSKRRRSN